LSDAVHDLGIEIRTSTVVLANAQIPSLDGSTKEVLHRLLESVEALDTRLKQTNAQLQRLAAAPLIGMLGGRAETEIQGLVGRVDEVRDALRGVVSAVTRR
jgi:hypothetical protein